jgi:hypothetical protein
MPKIIFELLHFEFIFCNSMVFTLFSLSLTTLRTKRHIQIRQKREGIF